MGLGGGVGLSHRRRPGAFLTLLALHRSSTRHPTRTLAITSSLPLCRVQATASPSALGGRGSLVVQVVWDEALSAPALFFRLLQADGVLLNAKSRENGTKALIFYAREGS